MVALVEISIIFGIANTDNTQWTIQSLWYFLPAGELTNLSFLCDVLTIPISKADIRHKN